MTVPNKPLDPVIEKLITALHESAGGIRGTVLGIKIKGVLIRWLNKSTVEIIRAIQGDLADEERKEFWNELRAGYCHDCANKIDDSEGCGCEREKS